MATKKTESVNVNNNSNVNNDANNNSVTELLAGIGINVNSSFSSRNIFRKEIMNNLTSDQKKVMRRKVRNTVNHFAVDIINNPRNEKLITEFNDFYKKVYSVNDYSLHSLVSSNRNNADTRNIACMLDIVKNFVKNSKNE